MKPLLLLLIVGSCLMAGCAKTSSSGGADSTPPQAAQTPPQTPPPGDPGGQPPNGGQPQPPQDIPLPPPPEGPEPAPTDWKEFNQMYEQLSKVFKAVTADSKSFPAEVVQLHKSAVVLQKDMSEKRATTQQVRDMLAQELERMSSRPDPNMPASARLMVLEQPFQLSAQIAMMIAPPAEAHARRIQWMAAVLRTSSQNMQSQKQ